MKYELEFMMLTIFKSKLCLFFIPLKVIASAIDVYAKLYSSWFAILLISHNWLYDSTKQISLEIVSTAKVRKQQIRSTAIKKNLSISSHTFLQKHLNLTGMSSPMFFRSWGQVNPRVSVSPSARGFLEQHSNAPTPREFNPWREAFVCDFSPRWKKSHRWTEKSWNFCVPRAAMVV